MVPGCDGQPRTAYSSPRAAPARRPGPLKILANALQGIVNVGAASPTNMHDTKTYNVYRDDYTPHGHAVCASLQRLGGPPCPTRAEGVRIACDHVREAFRQYAPHKKKRCVPMTGKQKCEVVPGGCTN